MSANNTGVPNAANVQGPAPGGNPGYPMPVVPTTGSDPFPVASVGAVETIGSEAITVDGDFVQIDVTGYAQVSAQLVGVFTGGFITVRASADNWATNSFVTIFNSRETIGAGAVVGPSGTGNRAFTNGMYLLIPCVGYRSIRITGEFGFVGNVSVIWTASPTTNVVEQCGYIVHTYDYLPLVDGLGNAPMQFVTELLDDTYKVCVLPMLYRGEADDAWDRERTPTTFKPLDIVAINPAAPIWTPAAGKKFRLMGYHISGSVAGNIVLKDGAGGTIIAVIPAAAGGGGTYVSLGNGILSAAADNILEALGPALDTISGTVFGTEE